MVEENSWGKLSGGNVAQVGIEPKARAYLQVLVRDQSLTDALSPFFNLATLLGLFTSGNFFLSRGRVPSAGVAQVANRAPQR